MKTMIIALSLLASVPALASDFCAFSAIDGARALANTNATISRDVAKVTSADGRRFTVVLSEDDLGQDVYYVTTSGGHECTVYSVRVKGEPTRRP